MSRHATPPLSQRLPLEICEEVIGFVDVRPLRISQQSFTNTCRRTLYSCTLVCRDWLPKSRIRLFRWVNLASRQQAASFMTTICTTPQHGEYVQALVISLRDDSIYKVHQSLPPLLPNLTHLHYSRLPALHSVFFILPSRFSTITSLRFQHIEQLSFREVVRIINRFPNLQKLELSDCVWTSPGSFYCRRPKDERVFPAHFSVSTSLSRFSRGGVSGDCQSEDTIHWLMKKLPLDTLSEYRCSNKVSRPKGLRDLMERHSKSLKRLELHVELRSSEPESKSESDELASLFSALASCRNLQDVGIKLGKPGTPSLPQVIEPLLSSLPNSIRRIELMFLVRSEIADIFHADSDQVKWTDCWNTIDTALTRDRFPNLTYVELAVDTSIKTYGFEDGLFRLHNYGTLKGFLPKLYGRGILWFGDPSTDVAYGTIGEPLDWLQRNRLFPKLQWHRSMKRQGGITRFPMDSSVWTRMGED